MAHDDLDQLLQRLQAQRQNLDFPGQLATYQELGRAYARSGAYPAAAQVLRRATQVAEYLQRTNEEEAICYALIAVHEQAGDAEAVIGVYSQLHILFTLRREPARAAEYNKVRLELIAQQIGTPHPSFQERFQYEYKLAGINLRTTRERYERLLAGDELPAVPDEHATACAVLVDERLLAGDHDGALRYISTCERVIKGLPEWTTADGLTRVQGLRQAVEQRKREATPRRP